MENANWPLREKYQPRARFGDYKVQKGHGRSHGGNNARQGRHKLSVEEKRRGLNGYTPYIAPMFRMVDGKLRKVHKLSQVKDF